MVREAEGAGIARIGLPRIGAGLGGLAWADVRAIRSKMGGGTTVELLVFEEYEPIKKAGCSGEG
jgi:hypothetical protein